MRPMREFSNKELIFYLKLQPYVDSNELPFKQNDVVTGKPIKSSINRMTENFLLQLQEDFPSTLYAIFKTGNKIASVKQEQVDVKRCQFCWVNYFNLF